MGIDIPGTRHEPQSVTRMRPTTNNSQEPSARRRRVPIAAFLRAGGSGQSLVEFVLVLPILLLLFAAILDLGRMASAQIAITNAAREGAFQASVTPTDYSAGQPCPGDGKSNLVVCRTILETNGSSVTIVPSDIDVLCNPVDCSVGLGNTVSVNVSTKFQLLTPVLSVFFGGARVLDLSATSVAQIETLPTPTFTPPWATPSPTPDPSASPDPSAAPTPTPIMCSLPSAGFNFDASPNSYRAPVTMTVTDNSTDGGCAITSWTWDWGDGTRDFVRNPIPHPYGSPGDYSITLTVSNAAGSNTTGAVLIRVKP